jgi:CBS domain-containing protein
VLNLIREHSDALGSLARAPVGHLFPLAAPLVVPHTATLRQCFTQLHDHGYNGCAVVDAAGAIVTNISVSDVRGLGAVAAGVHALSCLTLGTALLLACDMATRFCRPVQRIQSPLLLLLSCADGGDVDTVLDEPAVAYLGRTCGGGAGLRVPVTAGPSDTLSSVIELLCAAHIHRVHIVDNHRRPVGVVTTMDVLRVVLSSEVLAHVGERGTSAGAGVSPCDNPLSPACLCLVAFSFARLAVWICDLLAVAPRLY